MRNALALPFALCLLAAAPAFAHDTLPAQWCPAGTTPQVVSTFTLSNAGLIAYRSEHLGDGAVLGTTCSDPKSCGIVDEWFWANQAATEACGRSAEVRGGTSVMAMPVIQSPDAFGLDTDTNHNGIPDHHDLYRFKSGLGGVCVICTAPATPVANDPRS